MILVVIVSAWIYPYRDGSVVYDPVFVVLWNSGIRTHTQQRKTGGAAPVDVGIVGRCPLSQKPDVHAQIQWATGRVYSLSSLAHTCIRMRAPIWRKIRDLRENTADFYQRCAAFSTFLSTFFSLTIRDNKILFLAIGTKRATYTILVYFLSSSFLPGVKVRLTHSARYGIIESLCVDLEKYIFDSQNNRLRNCEIYRKRIIGTKLSQIPNVRDRNFGDIFFIDINLYKFVYISFFNSSSFFILSNFKPESEYAR